MSSDDRAQITEVLDRYAEALDLRRWEVLETVFAPEIAFDSGEWVVRGRPEVIAQIRTYLDGCGPTQHLLGNYRVALDGDRARSRVYVRAFHACKDRSDPRVYEMGGEYADELRRTPAGWRSVKRSLRVLFEVGTRDVLGMGAPRR
jgi:3-phenylpropionate/cinnamic acid dioxygenase small subunit